MSSQTWYHREGVEFQGGIGTGARCPYCDVVLKDEWYSDPGKADGPPNQEVRLFLLFPTQGYRQPLPVGTLNVLTIRVVLN